MADIDYFDSRVLTGVINKRPVKYDILGTMFRRQSPKAIELFELHVVSRGVSMLPSITNATGGTMRSGREGAAFAVKAPHSVPSVRLEDAPSPCAGLRAYSSTCRNESGNGPDHAIQPVFQCLWRRHRLRPCPEKQA